MNVEGFSIPEIPKEVAPLIGEALRRIGWRIIKDAYENIHGTRLVFVGAGELGYEMGFDAFDKLWYRFFTDNEDVTPVEKLPAALKEHSKGKKKWGRGLLKTEIYRKIDVNNIDEICDIIKEKYPSYLILEKNFVRPEVWSSIPPTCKSNSHFLRKDLVLLPNTTRVWNFIDKKNMKIKIENIFNNGKYLVPYKFIKNSRDKENVIKEIEMCLEKSPEGVVLKPRITSNGRGQSTILTTDSADDIEKALLQIQTSRVQRDGFIVEKNVPNLKEIYFATFRHNLNLDAEPRVIGPIKYIKEWETGKQIGGPVLLRNSIYPPNSQDFDSEILSKIEGLTGTLCRAIKVPFLGIEFFISGENIFINELVWRPEDAGFITLLSHSRNQFEVFLECLSPPPLFGEPVIEQVEACSSEHGYLCKPIVREMSWAVGDRDFPTVPFETWDIGLVHLFKKELDGKTPRIVGYLVSDKNEEEKMERLVYYWLERFTPYDEDIRKIYIIK